MGKRRRKTRTHLKGGEAGEEAGKAPKSFVIKVSCELYNQARPTDTVSLAR